MDFPLILSFSRLGAILPRLKIRESKPGRPEQSTFYFIHAGKSMWFLGWVINYWSFWKKCDILPHLLPYLAILVFWGLF